MTFEELYGEAVRSSVRGGPFSPPASCNPDQLDCLLHPEKYAPVVRTEICGCGGEDHCAAACLFDAVSRDPDGNVFIDPDKCSGCAACIEACQSGVLAESRDVLPALDAVKHAKGPVYALIAPAFLGQFPGGVSPGQLRSAFRALGFSGMIEVALFADILTLKEGLAFDRKIQTEEDYLLTSCCCPVWIAMIRKLYTKLTNHIPGSVSPMIAAGRTVKVLSPDALTVFVGPCLAKKAEAREADLRGAVDYVLTFREVQDIFSAAGIVPAECDDSQKTHSSRAGRIYARAGGVSEAVSSTVSRLSPEKKIRIRTETADGIPSCKKMLETLVQGEVSANFFEGMGCVGGCVGGPKAILNREEAKENVDRYGTDSLYQTPMENPYVFDLLKRLGFSTVDEFLEKSDMFDRNFE